MDIQPNIGIDLIPSEFILKNYDHWQVNHRLGSTYPGYLMASSKEDVCEISELSAVALAELGTVLSDLERIIMKAYGVRKVLMSKLGISIGFNCHFHVVPVYDWIMQAIESNPSYTNEPDGNDVMLYVNREYCEGQKKRKWMHVAKESIVFIKSVIETE